MIDNKVINNNKNQNNKRTQIIKGGWNFYFPKNIKYSNLPPRQSLKIIPLGGLEEIGKNCYVFEYGNDILVVDLGLMFPTEEMLGIDYVVPDVSYLEKNKNKIRGVIITHGHLDHIGAIPYLIEKIGKPPIYASKLTAALIKDRLEEFKLEKKVKVFVFNENDILQLGIFKVFPFRVNHNIPDSMGFGILTPIGMVVHTCDFKFDFMPTDGKITEFHKLALFRNYGVVALMSDSTNAEKQGYAISEKVIGENLEELFSKAKGRIIVATFSTLISRIQQIINASIKFNRKITVSGLSLEKTIETAVRLGYINLPPQYFVPLKEIDNHPDERLTIITTGSQGEEESSLTRISKGEHRHIKIKKGDLVVLSSSPIPGNERSIQNLMNTLFKLGAKVVYNKIFDVHVSGHGYQEELKLMMQVVDPIYFIPIHGERHMLEMHAELARELGFKNNKIFILSNGDVLEIKATKKYASERDVFNWGHLAEISPIKLPLKYVMVDGLGIGDIGNVVLRDRQVLAQDGMVSIILTIDNKTKKLINDPDIISRGFVYMKGSGTLIEELKKKTREIVENYKVQDIENWAPLREAIREQIGAFLFQKTERRPMILPVVIEV